MIKSRTLKISYSLLVFNANAMFAISAFLWGFAGHEALNKSTNEWKKKCLNCQILLKTDKERRAPNFLTEKLLPPSKISKGIVLCHMLIKIDSISNLESAHLAGNSFSKSVSNRTVWVEWIWQQRTAKRDFYSRVVSFPVPEEVVCLPKNHFNRAGGLPYLLRHFTVMVFPTSELMLLFGRTWVVFTSILGHCGATEIRKRTSVNFLNDNKSWDKNLRKINENFNFINVELKFVSSRYSIAQLKKCLIYYSALDPDLFFFNFTYPLISLLYFIFTFLFASHLQSKSPIKRKRFDI